ncbi:hypothetical protein ILUMI_13351 [Ignelater luminosus]|uniref:Uncharacterized protein n=1 Tax=Ignelater luminosus TaxID=2038154 RepID=A0A8K0CSJ2_IGNLU|nr:hypothetical protein ILUMI_13351 [Ignelater luminosus]
MKNVEEMFKNLKSYMQQMEFRLDSRFNQVIKKLTKVKELDKQLSENVDVQEKIIVIEAGSKEEQRGYKRIYGAQDTVPEFRIAVQTEVAGSREAKRTVNERLPGEDTHIIMDASSAILVRRTALQARLIDTLWLWVYQLEETAD